MISTTSSDKREGKGGKKKEKDHQNAGALSTSFTYPCSFFSLLLSAELFREARNCITSASSSASALASMLRSGYGWATDTRSTRVFTKDTISVHFEMKEERKKGGAKRSEGHLVVPLGAAHRRVESETSRFAGRMTHN